MRQQGISRQRLFAGAVLILLGVLFLLGTLDVWNMESVWDSLWPLFIILFGALWLVSRWPDNILGPIVVIAIGVLFLGSQNGWFGSLDIGDLWPLLLILVGLLVLLRAVRRPVPSPVSARVAAPTAGAVPKGAGEDVVDQFAMFGGSERRLTTEHFRGGRATAFFGGTTVDLRGAKLAPEGAVLDATAAFGGVDVKVPADWPVVMDGMALFGGFGDERKETVAPVSGAPALVVKGLAAFGGVSVKTG